MFIHIEELYETLIPAVNKAIEKAREHKGPGKSIDYEVVLFGKSLHSQALLDEYHLELSKITKTSMVHVVADSNKISDCLIERSLHCDGDFVQFVETDKFSVSVYPSPEPKCGFCGHHEFDAVDDGTNLRSSTNSCGYCNNVSDYYKRFNLFR